jgi:LuxR family maltose regulon positive regulatory protein
MAGESHMGAVHAVCPECMQQDYKLGARAATPPNGGWARAAAALSCKLFTLTDEGYRYLCLSLLSGCLNTRKWFVKNSVLAQARVVNMARVPQARAHQPSPPEGDRYQPPRMAQAVLVRQPLNARLSHAEGVLLVTGPPGAGKTSLLAQWHAELVAQSQPTRWLTLSAEDNSPQVLHHHLNKAFSWQDDEQVCPPEWLEVPQAMGGITGFIDGLECITDPVAYALAERFLLNPPASSCYVASAQRLRGAQLHDGRLRGVVHVLPPQALRLDASEALAVLGEGWSSSEAEQLNHCVDGWAAGLRFLARAPSIARCWLDKTQTMAVLPPEMADYFEDVLCANLAPQVLEVLMEASVLERFTPELLAALPAVGAGASAPRWPVLAEQIRGGFFVRYADEERHWVDFYAPFSRYLQQRMRRFQPDRYDEIKHFAAAWCVEKGHAAEAVRHAVAMLEMPAAAQIIEKAGAINIDLGNGPDVSLSTYLPAARAGELPLLFLGQIYHRLRHGQWCEARAAFEAACLHTQQFTRLHDEADGAVVRGWMHTLKVVFLGLDDLPVSEDQIARLEADLEALREAQPVLAVGIASVLAYVYLDQSRHADSAAVCSIGLHVRGHSEATKALLFVRLHQARNALARDSVDTAVLCVEEAQRLASIEGHSHSYEVLTTRIMRALLHYESNELAQAQELLSPALQHIRSINGWGRLYIDAFSTAVALAGQSEGLEAAEAMVRAGEDFARERSLPRLAQFMAMARLQQLRQAGDWRDAMALVESGPLADLLQQQSLDAYVLAAQVPALLEVAHLMIELGRPSEAMDRLDGIPRDFLDEADSRLRFGFHVLSMRASQGLRRYNAAAGHMRAAVDIARHTGLVLRALQAREHLLEVFDWTVRHGRDMTGWSERARAWVDDALRHASGRESADALQQRGRRQAVAPAAQNFALSPRETEIVALIVEGCINKEIAARLGIAEGTVKTHRKKIHEKLGIRNRSQLIVRARELLIV